MPAGWRRAIAVRSAAPVRRDVIRSDVAQPAMRSDHTSFTAQTETLPSAVGCLVGSVSQTRSGPAARKSRRTRSSCTAWPALAPPTAHRGRRELLRAAEPTHPVLGCDPARRVHLVVEEPVAERRVARMRIDQPVRQMRIIPIPLAHRISEPPVLRLA